MRAEDLNAFQEEYKNPFMILNVNSILFLVFYFLESRDERGRSKTVS